MSREIANLAARVAALEKRLDRTTRSARLAYSSIEAGAIEVHNRDGTLTGIVGVQPDGTTGITAVNGAPPPTPSAPLVEAGVAVVKVTWDGTFTDTLAAPLDLARVQVHVLTDPASEPDPRNPAATIEAASGATVTIGVAGYQAVWVRLVALNTSGRPGGASPATSAAPRRANRDDLATGAVELTHLSGALADSVAQGFADATFKSSTWAVVGLGTGASWTVVGSPDAQSGGTVGQATGAVSLGGRVRIPYEPTTLYRVSVRVRTTAQADPAAPDTVYLGLLGYAADGTTLVNRNGESSLLSQNYCAAAGASVAATSGWSTYTGYVRGRAVPGTSGPNRDLRNPGTMYDYVRYISPYVRLNYGNSPGTMQVDWVSVTAVQTGLVTVDNLAAGSVRAEHLDADAINGKTVTGAVVQTATGGRRLVMNPAARDGQPALEMYSGSRAEVAPGRVRSEVLDMGSWLQPEISVESPLVGGSRAGITLRSPEVDGQGRVRVQPSDQTDGHAHITVENGGPGADSTVTLYGSRGSRAGRGYHSVIVKGSGVTVHGGTRQMRYVEGVLSVPCIATGAVTITPTPNVPTSVTVSGLDVAGKDHRGFVTAASSVPGTIEECTVTNVSEKGLTVWVKRSNSTATNIAYLVIGS
ncbi:hypothetical protein [Streptomyces sp. MNP-20]|uniref:hypothetical protein n=1 Tax=Streptomyces sp. MNP-20 TaxID=2721165 RepID=UPI001555AA26|nr:hypothetical protein [Streptomyces sp. MNP-20]